MNNIDVLVDQIVERVRQQGFNSSNFVQKNPGYGMLNGNSMEKIKDAHDLAKYIDHTLLKPDATRAQLEKLCREAREHHFATVCVNSSNIPVVRDLLAGSGVLPIAVVGFPLGAATTAAKVFEAKESIVQGAGEIDMVLNIGALKSQDYNLVYSDIASVVEACGKVPVKVILETAMLEKDEKVIACVLSKLAKAAYVKTSTGFGPGGATVEDIGLMRKIVGPNMGVKASGGVRTYEDAVKMLEAGATRLGSSNSVAIVTTQAKKKWQF